MHLEFCPKGPVVSLGSSINEPGELQAPQPLVCDYNFHSLLPVFCYWFSFLIPGNHFSGEKRGDRLSHLAFRNLQLLLLASIFDVGEKFI